MGPVKAMKVGPNAVTRLTATYGNAPPMPSGCLPPRVRPRVRCTALRTNGRPCRAWAIHGGWVCWTHGGAAPQVRLAAQRRLELTAWQQEYVRWERWVATAPEAQAVLSEERVLVLDPDKVAAWLCREMVPDAL